MAAQVPVEYVQNDITASSFKGSEFDHSVEEFCAVIYLTVLSCTFDQRVTGN
jgi:hypothetical protein